MKTGHTPVLIYICEFVFNPAYSINIECLIELVRQQLTAVPFGRLRTITE